MTSDSLIDDVTLKGVVQQAATESGLVLSDANLAKIVEIVRGALDQALSEQDHSFRTRSLATRQPQRFRFMVGAGSQGGCQML